MEPLHAVFDSYRLEELDKDWINQVWESGFTNIDNVPIDYLMFLESPDLMELLKETCVVVKDWISQNSSQDDGRYVHSEVSWQTLIALNLDVRALLAVLTYLTKRGQAFDASQDSRQRCLRATSLYLVLLSVPGSNAFQAFHPVLYEIVLKTLSLSSRLVSPAKKSSKQDKFVTDDHDDSTDDEDRESEAPLSGYQNATLTRGLNGVMYDLVLLLKSASLGLEIHSLELTIYNLVEMTKLADENVKNFQQSARGFEASVSSLAYNAYVALLALCNTKYATVELITRIIGKYFLPHFLIGNSQLAPKQMAIVRDSTIHFYKTLLQEHGQSALPALTTLIQHLMIKSPDRLEGRQKQAVVLIKLMNLCAANGGAFAQSLRDLVQLSHHTKISCRIFAQEIIGKFLIEFSSMQSHTEREYSLWSATRTKKYLIASALGRCIDVSSMVRGRAIATLAEYTDSPEDPVVQELFKLERRNSGKEMPTLADLEEAATTDEADFALPDLRGIIDMLRKRGEDERALVRKSALQVLRNGVYVSESLLKDAIAMIKCHCRDATLTVRRFAIRVLTDLLEKFSERSSLCEDWVNYVVPRVFDSEAKVQEEVLDSLEKLTIAKITSSRNTENYTKMDLPWRILKEIAANKMGDHLTRACKIWVEGKTIAEAKVAQIKSHIGTENDIEAWLLLASISETKNISNMEIYYEYYERALKDSDNDDGFLASLCLQALRNCWSSFSDDSLRKIRSDLSKHLNAYEIRVPLISHCLDILYGITKHLEIKRDMEKRTMSDLMRLSESTISRIIDSCEEFEGRDPGSLLFRATCTLGHSSFLCCDKISTASLRTLQGFLLERSSLPEAIKSRRELQGAAIIVLGQQALRDRDVAQEMTPIFGRLLRNTGTENSIGRFNENIASGPAVRINAAKALADICVRFTTLVEPYLPDMCVSMKDTNSDVRQVILVIFIQLLVEDFIKINGAFFFHILTMLADSDATIRQMTMFLIKERLMTKNKSLITQQLVQSVFHFNDYERNAMSSRRNTRERRALTLSGEGNFQKRQTIYDFMLEHLDPPGKLAVLGTLTRQIFSRSNSLGTSIKELNFNCEKGRCVLRDAIYIASSEYLQPSSCGRQTNEDDSLEDGSQTTTAANSVIIEAIKKYRLEVFLPSLVELKRRFARMKSPLLVDVTKLIARTIGDYSKDQLAAFYNEYPKFEAELERDVG